jgi:hypothetical protein
MKGIALPKASSRDFGVENSLNEKKLSSEFGVFCEWDCISLKAQL